MAKALHRRKIQAQKRTESKNASTKSKCPKRKNASTKTSNNDEKMHRRKVEQQTERKKHQQPNQQRPLPQYELHFTTMLRLPLAVITLVMSIRISTCFLNFSCQRTLSAKKSLLLSFSTMITSSSSTPNNSCTTTLHSSKSSVNHNSKPLEETSEAYKQLIEKLRTITRLKRVSGLLDYDQMVMMPQSDDTAKQRGLQQSALASIIHEKSTEPILKDLIEKSLQDLGDAKKTLEEAKSTHIDFDHHHRILTLAKKSYDKKILIPPALEAKRAELSSEAYSMWVKARQASDFALFSDCLDDCFTTAKELAAVLQTDQDKKLLYTQMLDEYEMGMDAQRIDEIFGHIEKALKPLIAEVLRSNNPPSRAALEGKFDVQKQKEMCAKIVTKMGFDCEHGRIDQSVHPFTMSLGPQDVRITSRFKDTEWYQGLAATIHEGGHAMYEQNLKGDDLEINEYLSMGMHESQSLFWERHVGKTYANSTFTPITLMTTQIKSNLFISFRSIGEFLPLPYANIERHIWR